VGYVAAQCLGGIAGAALLALALGGRFTLPPISAVATVPGPPGHAVAFAAETVLGFVMMLTVLLTANRPGWMRWTGILAGALVAAFITIEAPLSGMSINPARSLASAVVSELWTGFWIYVSAPPLGMLLAVEAYGLLARDPTVRCAKLNHDTRRRCIFRCGYGTGGSHVP
jgi:aquaporin Z